jgi:hypothetical protein
MQKMAWIAAVAAIWTAPGCAQEEEPEQVESVSQAVDDSCAAGDNGKFIIIESATKVKPDEQQRVPVERLKIVRQSTIMCHQQAQPRWEPDPIKKLPEFIPVSLDTYDKYNRHSLEARLHLDGASLKERRTSDPTEFVKFLIERHCGAPGGLNEANPTKKRACTWQGSFQAFKCTGGRWQPKSLAVALSSDYRLLQTNSQVDQLQAISCHNGYDRCHLATVNATPVGPGSSPNSPSWYDTLDVSKTDSMTWQEADTWEAHASVSITAGANIPFTNIGVNTEVGTSISRSISKSHENVRSTTNSMGFQRQMSMEICPAAAEVVIEPDDTPCAGIFKYARMGVVKVTTRHVGGWWDKGSITDGADTWRYTPNLENSKLARVSGWLQATRVSELGGQAIKPAFFGCIRNKDENKEMDLLYWELGEDAAKRTIVKSGERWVDVLPSDGEPSVPPTGDPKYPNNFVGANACARP